MTRACRSRHAASLVTASTARDRRGSDVPWEGSPCSSRARPAHGQVQPLPRFLSSQGPPPLCEPLLVFGEYSWGYSPGKAQGLFGNRLRLDFSTGNVSMHRSCPWRSAQPFAGPLAGLQQGGRLSALGLQALEAAPLACQSSLQPIKSWPRGVATAWQGGAPNLSSAQLAQIPPL